MSEIFFLASNQPIKELSNQAQEILEKGNPIISAWKNRKMDTIALGQPKVYKVDCKEYENLPINKKYVCGLDFRWSEENVKLLLTYIKKHVDNSGELELWSEWLDDTEDDADVYRKKALLRELDYSFLDKFFEQESNVKMLEIRDKYY